MYHQVLFSDDEEADGEEVSFADPSAVLITVIVSVDALPESVDESLLEAVAEPEAALPESVDEFLLEALAATTVAEPELNPATLSLDELAAVDSWAGVLAIADGRAEDAALIWFCEAAEAIVSSGVEQILKTCNVP